MTPAAVNKMLKGVYSGDINTRNLPIKYYRSTVKDFTKTLSQGFGSKAGQKEFYGELSVNVQAFSGAKTYQLTRELQAARRGTKTYKEYAEKALPIYEKHQVWAESEHETIMAQAQNAKRWKQIEADVDIYPKLRYSAVMDEVTSDICRALNGLCLPVNHPVWRTKSPTNHWRCRCTLIQESKSTRSTSKAKVERLMVIVDEQMPGYFQNNVGISGEIFTKEHPYFTEMPKRDLAFARRNFDLPIK
ncbi:phage minor head protein [Chitinophaga sp. CC14]|uniref:phage head morphogenesis protein n=1 Tax=Chitinophaga sp. CC14 TaxID=3029199 RepID=UPI003B79BC5C